jgi:Tol biopolymer transport system component
MEFSPAWSPDGRWIAFLRGGLLNPSLFVMPSIGGEERKIGESESAGPIRGSVRWTPDGKWLVVSGSVEKSDSLGLFLIDFTTDRIAAVPRPRS